MAWDKGFNFRATDTFVTDGTDETYVRGYSDEYPITRNGATFGWGATPDVFQANRDSTVDRRLAGINYLSNDGVKGTFRVDLTATGDYTLRFALGDTASGQQYQYAQFRDNTTAFATIDDTNGTAVDNYDDATGVNRTEANWPSQNATLSRTFASTILNVIMGPPSAQLNSTTFAHLFVSQVAVAAEALGHGLLLSGIRNAVIQRV